MDHYRNAFDAARTSQEDRLMHPAINKMVSPGQPRPRIMRGGIIQLVITRACDLACFHCTQGSNLAGKPAMMTVEQFDEACASLEGFPGVIGCFGGNCALHPQFDELCRIMRARFPREQRGLWCNNLNGKGAVARATFDVAHSNLNCHLNSDAYDEFCRDWPESIPYLKGQAQDSVHSSPWVAMRDVVADEEERWRLIGECDVNRWWSAALGVFRGKLRAYFCEIAYSQAALHADNPDWCGTKSPLPDTGLVPFPGWWRLPMEAFREQVETHCHACGIPLRRPGQFAIGGDHEEFSETHRYIARPKTRGRPVQMIESIGTVERPDRPATDYLPNTTPKQR